MTRHHFEPTARDAVKTKILVDVARVRDALPVTIETRQNRKGSPIFEMVPGRANEIAWRTRAHHIYDTDDPDGGNLRQSLNVDEADPDTLVNRKRRRTSGGSVSSSTPSC